MVIVCSSRFVFASQSYMFSDIAVVQSLFFVSLFWLW
jgi:hypothetical protein